MKDSFNALLIKGEKVRETGDPKRAIDIFRKAFKNTKGDKQKAQALRQEALSFEHLGKLSISLKKYDKALIYAEKSKDKSEIARILRHKSSCVRKMGNFDKAIELSKEARKMMLEVIPLPTDTCWITHGIVQAMIEKKTNRAVIWKWCLIELKDLLYMLPREKNQIRKRVWLTGWMMDTSDTLGVFGKPLRRKALQISKINKLKLREKQMSKKG
jgi:tetratricopeptide (TPR) repeat protein